MKFKFQQLGLLDDVEIDLSDLTIICGENNTGKTYATYAIYGFLRNWRQMLLRELDSEIEILIRASKDCHIDLNELFSNRVNDYLQKIANRYQFYLPKVFATKEDAFNNSKITVSIDKELNIDDTEFLQKVHFGSAGKVLATISKNSGSSMLDVLVSDDDFAKQPFGGLSGFVVDAIADIVFADYFPRVHIASAERTGAAIFRRELDTARTRMLETLHGMDSNELKRNPFKLIESMDSGYALPVQDNVDFVRKLEDINKNTSELSKQYPEIIDSFDEVIGGSYKVIKDVGLVFQSKNTGKAKYTMNEASSCVRALLDIGFYLRCRAKKGDLFIIDEPELNLHPKNQRAFARLIVRLVNAGVKVFITTHSDYLIKEFNTLIMLAQRTEHTKAVQTRYGYEDAELLDYTRVHLYTTAKPKKSSKFNTLKLANITSDYGIEVNTFDTTIEEMNQIQSDILYGEE